MEAERTIPVCYRHPDRETRLACTACGRPMCVECMTPAPVGQRCPECSAPNSRQMTFKAEGRPPVTTAIIAAAGALFLVEFLLPSFGQRLFIWMAQHNPSVLEGEWWRVLTGGFLHAGITHILFNMWALSAFGPGLEREVGSRPFAGLYLASLLWGGVAYLWLAPTGLAIGASGAIFGLFGAWTVVSVRNRHTASGRAQFRQMVLLLGINAALPLLVPQIAWQAHLGGFVAGAVIAAAWLSLATHARSQLWRALVAYGAAALALVAVFAA